MPAPVAPSPAGLRRRCLLTAAAALGLAAHRFAEAAAPRATRVALFVNGTLGDRSFYDSAARGLQTVRSTLHMRTRVIEAGLDPTRWEPTLLDVADGDDFDVILVGSFTMVPLLQKVAARHPRTRFIVFDATVDYTRGASSNVHSIVFGQNEGAYLAGWLAARLAPAGQGIGVVGGMQIPVIDDFIIGYTAGAKAGRPGIPVARQYVNSFTDPATAKEIAKAMFGRGDAVLFHAAGGAGQGVLEAAAEAGRLVIGADSDQYALVRAASAARARVIVTSVLKNVDVAVARALARHADGSLPYGRAQSLGLTEGGVSLAEGSEVWRRLPAALLTELRGVQAAIGNATLKVPSAFDAAGRGGPST